MPTVQLMPIEGEQGYRLVGDFPVEGLNIQGTLMRTAPSAWRLSGHFLSNTEAFRPGAPAVSVMGALVPEEGAGLKFEGNAKEVLIVFPAAMPPADAPIASETVVRPFEVDIQAPDDAQFVFLMLPF